MSKVFQVSKKRKKTNGGTATVHSSDRTLLMKLGFSDLDKKILRHDLACQYIAQIQQASRLVMNCAPASWDCKDCAVCVTPEFHITKGREQYKTTIGFADLWMSADVLDEESVQSYIRAHGPESPPAIQWCRKHGHWIDANTGKSVGSRLCSALVEVKIAPVSVGDALRQLQLYRDYTKPTLVALVTDYDVDVDDAHTLDTRGVRHIRLGVGFRTYCEMRQNERVVADSFQL